MYKVVRVFWKNDGTEAHSVEMKESYEEALKRYFTIIATDLGNADIVKNEAYVIDPSGTMIEGRIFAREEETYEEE